MTCPTVEDPHLILAAESVPRGPWALALSGGADSVALLRLLHATRSDLAIHVVHLDHETREGASTSDAGFVARLCESLSVTSTIVRRSQIEATMTGRSANPSAHFRACRLKLFTEVVERHHLAGVLVAHHADDQAESILLRLLRGNSFNGLVGMSESSVVNGVRMCRPLLDVRRESLRAFLVSIGQTWREDSSNASDDYARNRVRKLLADRPEWVAPLLELSARCRTLRQWTADHAPTLDDEFDVRTLAHAPRLLAEESARQWLVVRGVPDDELERPVVARLLIMASDAASPAVTEFPGGVRVRRRGGKISRVR